MHLSQAVSVLYCCMSFLYMKSLTLQYNSEFLLERVLPCILRHAVNPPGCNDSALAHLLEQ